MKRRDSSEVARQQLSGVSANEVFHCVHFECPAQRASLSPFEGSNSSTSSAPSTSEIVMHGDAADANAQGDPSADQQVD